MEKIKKALNESPFARWGILLLAGFILSVNYYFYDAFPTLKYLPMREFNFTNTHYGLFISFYSRPNTFLLMAVVGGMILDHTRPGNPEVLDHTPTILMFAVLGLLGLFFVVMLKREDNKYNLGVDLPFNKK